MTHKRECMKNAYEYLQGQGLHQHFCLTTFNSYYRKHHGAYASAWWFGIEVAEAIIRERKLQPFKTNITKWPQLTVSSTIIYVNVHFVRA